MGHRVLDLERYVPALITFVSNKLSAGASAVYLKNFGMGVTDWRIIAMLAVEPNITASRISQVIGLNKAAISRSLKVLGELGLVASRPDSSNERRKLVKLNEKGLETHDRIIKLALAREQLLLQPFTDDEIDTFIDILQRMHKQVEIVNAMQPTEEGEVEHLGLSPESLERHTIEAGD